jgi:hypothetical protein
MRRWVGGCEGDEDGYDMRGPPLVTWRSACAIHRKQRCGLRSAHTAADEWVPLDSNTRDARCGVSMASGPLKSAPHAHSVLLGHAEGFWFVGWSGDNWPMRHFSSLFFILGSPFIFQILFWEFNIFLLQIILCCTKCTQNKIHHDAMV